MAKTKASNKDTKKGFEIKLGVKEFFFTGTVFFLVVVWAFILGIIVGRGYGPIDILSSLKGKNPISSKKNSIRSKIEVLHPTELTFYKNIKQDSLEKLVGEEKKSSPSIVRKKAQTQSNNKYLIQVSSYKNKKDALSLVTRLKNKGFSSKIERVNINSKHWYRVYVVFIGDEKGVKGVINSLRKIGVRDFIIRRGR